MQNRLLNYMLATFLSIAVAGPASAEEIKVEHAGLTVNANLSSAQDGWQTGTGLLIIHGTLAHNGMEIIATLQGLLAEQGITSLEPPPRIQSATGVFFPGGGWLARRFETRIPATLPWGGFLAVTLHRTVH